jgi:hypothetical protein
MAMIKKPTNGSKTKPFNSRLMTPKELTGLPKKKTAKATPKATTKPKSPMSKKLTGEAAAEAVRKSTTPKGVKAFEKGASKALDKKYPGLYKKKK